MTQVRITGAQAVALIACLAFGKSIGLSTGAMARLVGHDMLLAALFAFLGAFALVVPLVGLARRFPEQRPPEWVRLLLGRWAGGLLLLLLTLFLLGSYILSAVTIVLHLNDYLLPETPTLLFVVGISLLACYAAQLGLEVIARLAILGLSINALLGLLVGLGSAMHIDISHMLPLGESGMLPIMQASTIAWTDSAMSLAGLLFLWPRTAAQPSRWLNLSWLAMLLATLTVMIWPALEQMTMGPEVTAQYLIACMQLARTATLGIFLHRYELIMMLLFGWGTLVQTATLLYLGLELLREVVPLKVSRGWYMHLATLAQCPIVYQLARDRELLDRFHTYIWPGVALPIALGLPLLLWLVALVRRQGPGTAPQTTGAGGD